MSQAELPRELTAQPADEVTEKYWQLIRQNRAFCRALTEGSSTITGTLVGRKRRARPTLTSLPSLPIPKNLVGLQHALLSILSA
jgi:hypothetical protein